MLLVSLVGSVCSGMMRDIRLTGCFGTETGAVREVKGGTSDGVRPRAIADHPVASNIAVFERFRRMGGRIRALIGSSAG